ncbi:unnamed protein product [Linum tenue]|uniref:Uncharacterized protein n=1 Tax=Linum tenue TaxID=586396 RepID=A0AAV0R3L0_9ROSI|nr:unnamed protein product [Linum tenue]
MGPIRRRDQRSLEKDAGMVRYL